MLLFLVSGENNMTFLKITFAVLLTVTASFWISAKIAGRNKVYERHMDIVNAKLKMQSEDIEALKTKLEALQAQSLESK